MCNKLRKLTIAGECVCKYQIVYNENSNKSEANAANELAKYIAPSTKSSSVTPIARASFTPLIAKSTNMKAI